MAKKGTYNLFANGQYLTAVTDNALSTGTIGLAVVNRNTLMDAEFSNVQIWAQ